MNRNVSSTSNMGASAGAGSGKIAFRNDDAQAKAAMNATNGHELNGRALNVNEARPREERLRPYGAKRSFAGNRW